MVGSGFVDSNQHFKICDVQGKHQLKYKDARYTVHYITPRPTFNGMGKVPSFIK